MGSGGFFVSSDRFIEEHAGEKQYNAAEQKRNISVYGQESNPTTWKLAAMNMAIRGIDFNFGSKNADTLLDDQHPDLRADFVMANPPFNMKEWWSAKLENDVRWKYGTPPQGNANFAWMQHDPPPRAKRLDGAAAGERLDEFQHQQRRRNPPQPDRSRSGGVHGCAAGPALYQHPNPGLYLVPDQRQIRRQRQNTVKVKCCLSTRARLAI
jgi:type I restriction enzyme M protein